MSVPMYNWKNPSLQSRDRFDIYDTWEEWFKNLLKNQNFLWYGVEGDNKKTEQSWRRKQSKANEDEGARKIQATTLVRVQSSNNKHFVWKRHSQANKSEL